LNLAFLPIAQCPIAAPILWRATEALLAELNQRAGPWLKRAPFTLDQLELFTTANQSHLQISLFVRTSAKTLPAKLAGAFNALCEALRAHIPQLAGAGIYLLPTRSARSRRAEQPRPGPTWGSPGLTYSIPSLEPRTSNLEPQSYWVPRTAFFQINRFLLPELVSLVSPDPVAANRAGQSAWDLYAGVGLFSRALAPHFTRVTAVEIAEPAFTALAQTKLPNLHAVKATTLDFLRTAVLQRDRPDRIVLDPPRTGAGPEVCALLARIAAPTLIYVSCSPETLPSDLHTLAASGYRVAQLHLLDLFPQTTHIETVAILTR
jgi:23S rRNA (uracil1939-C5)-methyltransferase